MSKLLAIFFIFILFLGGCRKKSHAKKPSVVVHEYALKADGVECLLCAKTAMRTLQGIDCITDIKFMSPDGQYENGYIYFSSRNFQEVPLELVSKRLREKGFMLTSIKGAFGGTVIPGNESRQLNFYLKNWPHPLLIRGTTQKIQDVFESCIMKRQQPLLEGLIKFNHHQKLYELYFA
jgi:hypothetical protein